MRLIDVDALIERLKKDNPQTSKLKWAQIVADNAPTIDAVEVVRCKDCRKHKTYNCPFGEYDFPGNYMYCYYGERREE